MTTSEYRAGWLAPWLSIVKRPTVIGNRLSSEIMMYGSRKLFQIATNCRSSSVTMPGIIGGSPTFQASRYSPAPSMRPASSMSSETTEAA
jgi:hypothetical protein